MNGIAWAIAEAPARYPNFIRHLARRALDRKPPTGFVRGLVVDGVGPDRCGAGLAHYAADLIGIEVGHHQPHPVGVEMPAQVRGHVAAPLNGHGPSLETQCSY